MKKEAYWAAKKGLVRWCGGNGGEA